MDKRQSSARQVDCRMMHRSRCFRMIVGESGCPRITDLLISRTAGLLPQMPYVTDGYISSRGTRLATCGFQRKTVYCTCWRDAWLSRSHGRSWDVPNVPRFYSQAVSQADCGLHSGKAGDCCISRTIRSARRSQPLMVSAREVSPTFNSIGMAPYGPQPTLALAGLKMVASRTSPAGKVCPATRFT